MCDVKESVFKQNLKSHIWIRNCCFFKRFKINHKGWSGNPAYSSAHPSKQQWTLHTWIPEGTDLSPEEFCSSLNKRTCTPGTSFLQTLRLFDHLSFMCMESTKKIVVGKGETALTAYHKLIAAGHQVTSICNLEHHVCISGNKLVFLLVVQILY